MAWLLDFPTAVLMSGLQYEGDVRTPKEDLMKLFASTLGVPVELFTVPVLSEPREYEAAEYWRYELGAELD